MAQAGAQVSSIAQASSFEVIDSMCSSSFTTAMECQQAKCGTVPPHHYLNTTLIMNTPDPNYGRTVRLNHATGSLVTADGGKTWTAADITVQQYTYT
jgi:hypothetical protein